MTNFTITNGDTTITYKFNPDTKRYSKTVSYPVENGKTFKQTTRIGKAEFDKKFAEYDASTGLGDQEHEGLHEDYTPEEEAELNRQYHEMFGDDEDLSAWDAVDGFVYDIFRRNIEDNLSESEAKQVIMALSHDNATVLAISENLDSMDDNSFTDFAVALAKKVLYPEETPATKKKAKKPAKRFRKVQEGGFEYSEGDVHIHLTPKQVDFFHHLPDTSFWENGLDSCLWVDCLCDDIGGQFAGKPMTVGAMISTLCEKDLGIRGKDRVNGRKATSFTLTALGKQVAAMLGVH